VKKIYFIKFTLLVLFVTVFILGTSNSSVYSQLDSSSANHNPFQKRLGTLKQKRLELKEKRDTKIQDFKEKVATRQSELRTKTVNRIKTYFSKILRRLTAAQTRLDKIEDRIASRIDKLKEKGVDTSKAEAALIQAENAGSAAASAIDNAQLEIGAIDAQSATVREAVSAAKTAVKQAKQALVSYHKALVAAIRQLKASADLREGTGSAN